MWNLTKLHDLIKSVDFYYTIIANLLFDSFCHCYKYILLTNIFLISDLIGSIFLLWVEHPYKNFKVAPIPPNTCLTVWVLVECMYFNASPNKWYCCYCYCYIIPKPKFKKEVTWKYFLSTIKCWNNLNPHCRKAASKTHFSKLVGNMLSTNKNSFSWINSHLSLIRCVGPFIFWMVNGSYTKYFRCMSHKPEDQ